MDAGGRQNGAYRRNRVPNGTYFFAVTLRSRQGDALVCNVDALREAWRSARSRTPHEAIAVVVLPDHLHAVLRMRDGGDYSLLWHDIKSGFTRRTTPASAPSPWQPRFWEHTIRDEDALQRHAD